MFWFLFPRFSNTLLRAYPLSPDKSKKKKAVKQKTLTALISRDRSVVYLFTDLLGHLQVVSLVRPQANLFVIPGLTSNCTVRAHTMIDSACPNNRRA
jgi:hypothetical protein